MIVDLPRGPIVITLEDNKIAKLSLPLTKQKIGVFISGGIDSAILYYLILLKNKTLGNLHEIIPITIHRKEGSKHFAKLVINYVNACHDIEPCEALIVGDTTLPENQQVKSGVLEAYSLGFNIVFVGVITQLPEHMIGFEIIPYLESFSFRVPFKLLDKSNVIDIIRQFKQEGMFHITHSCDIYEIGRCNKCNGCRERAWGFSKLVAFDPGRL
jgi:7-cyano-7-deazaguanine synthase in queuosine biosynthesis